MPAILTGAAKSLILYVPRPYEDDGVTPVDHLEGMMVWYSTVSGFDPLLSEGTLAYDGPNLACVIYNLDPNITYYVRYAVISSIDPSVIELSAEMSAVTLSDADLAAIETALSDISDDNKLTAVEKKTVRRDWDAAVLESAGINANASIFPAAAAFKTTYNDMLQALGTYLNAGVAYTISTTTPPSWLNATNIKKTTVIVGDTFRAKWSDFYNARQDLLNKISEEASKGATWTNVSGRPESLGDLDPAAATSLDAAVANANAAKSDAAAAMLEITDISSDTKFTAAEKKIAEKEWEGLMQEKGGINTSASGFTAAASLNTAYNDALQALGTYLNAGTAFTIANWQTTPPTWLNATNINKTTTIVRATFKAKWNDVYVARQNLLNKIATEAAKTAAWSSVSGAPTSLSGLNPTEGSKLSGIATGATKNTIYRQSSTPASATIDDIWVNTSTQAVYYYNGSTWSLAANTVTNTSQLTDGAGLGQSAAWTGVSGKPTFGSLSSKSTVETVDLSTNCAVIVYGQSVSHGTMAASVTEKQVLYYQFTIPTDIPANSKALVTFTVEGWNSTTTARNFILSYSIARGANSSFIIMNDAYITAGAGFSANGQTAKDFTFSEQNFGGVNPGDQFTMLCKYTTGAIGTSLLLNRVTMQMIIFKKTS